MSSEYDDLPTWVRPGRQVAMVVPVRFGSIEAWKVTVARVTKTQIVCTHKTRGTFRFRRQRTNEGRHVQVGEWFAPYLASFHDEKVIQLFARQHVLGLKVMLDTILKRPHEDEIAEALQVADDLETLARTLRQKVQSLIG
jgi:hypothetical protein